ncbi:MAG: nitroreductase family protein [Gemmatimonadota bacterium]|jgi:nitroreductase
MPHTSTLDTIPAARPAPTRVDIHPLIAGRWSPRAIAETPVEPEKITAVMEAARWAPSSFNEQPWRFLVATTDEPEWLERLRGYLKSGNAWALRAPVLVASAYRERFTRNDKPNRMALRDLGAAEENAFLEALHQGLSMHQMGGFDARRLEEELLHDGFAPGSMWALGYPTDPTELDPERRRVDQSPRRRRPLEEVVFGPRWGLPAGFIG